MGGEWGVGRGGGGEGGVGQIIGSLSLSPPLLSPSLFLLLFPSLSPLLSLSEDVLSPGHCSGLSDVDEAHRLLYAGFVCVFIYTCVLIVIVYVYAHTYRNASMGMFV